MEQASLDKLFRDDGLTQYEAIKQIGEGCYGKVYKIKQRDNGEILASKKIKFKSGDKSTEILAVREMKILIHCRHKNVLKLLETKFTPGLSYVHVVTEFCEFDLARILGWRSVAFSLAEAKGMLHQLLQGLDYLHQRRVMHRDIKNNNILINKDGEIKIADFGMARSLKDPSVPGIYSPRVVTLWYRAPEVLLLRRDYGLAVDMWAFGCLMAEMWTREPILKGTSEIHQLHLIINLCGSITPESYPGVENMTAFSKMRLPTNRRRRVTERMTGCVEDDKAINLIEKLLSIDSVKRIDAKAALSDDLFNTEPLPCNLKGMVCRFSESISF